MAGASIEATLELWASSLRDVKERIRALFTQERVAASAGAFLDGLLGNERRKTGWMRAEAAGVPGPWRQQAILGRGRWEADDLRDIVRGYALETLADDDVAFATKPALAVAMIERAIAAAVPFAFVAIEKLVRVEGCRWAIEDSFETAKNELGLDHNETRSWHGWNRHVSLVMLAFAMTATIRHRANTMPTQQTIPQIFVARRLSAGPFRKFAA